MPIQIYTAEQVAALMGCSVKTVEAMARDGDLPGIKPGGAWIFPSGALASQLDALAVEQSRARKACWLASTTLTARRQLSWPVEVGGFLGSQRGSSVLS